jgi:hypothetical protein
VTPEVLIEDLVAEHPRSVSFLMTHGIVCIACGEPIWGTLREAAERKGLSVSEIEDIVRDLNAALAEDPP